MFRIFIFLFNIFILFCSREKISPLHASEGIPESPNLQMNLSTIKNAKGYFLQKEALESEYFERKGTFSFQRDGKFKWSIEYPNTQLIVSDGELIFQYDSDLKQVLIHRFDAAFKNSPIDILFRLDIISKSFDIKELPSADGSNSLRIISRDKKIGFNHIDVAFKEHIPLYLEFVDLFDKKTRIDFSDVRVNIILPFDEFDFVIPEGSNVIHM